MMKWKKNSLKKFLTGGIFVLLGILIFNSFFVFSAGNNLDIRIAEAKELAKPAEVEIITLTTSCSDCFSIDEIITVLKDAESLKLMDEQSIPGDSWEASNLIAKYEITKLPTIIIKGDIDDASIQNFVKKDDVLIFQGHSPPYIDAVTQQVKGKVNAIVINDKTCEECEDLSLHIQNIKQSGVIIEEEELLDASDEKAKEWIAKLNILKLPVLLISDDIDIYPISDNMQQSGLSAKDGYYLVESNPPYVDVATGNIRGLVTLTMIEDQSCEECYDVNLHKQIIGRMGLALKNEKTIDINSIEGVQIRTNYNLEKVPTIMLNGDVGVYEGFNNVWQKVGTIEDDGTYIFRNVELLGKNTIYKELTTGKIIGLVITQPTP